jgi:hypothetical protein
MKISSVVSAVGGVILVAVGFINVGWTFLYNPTAWDIVAFVLFCAILALIGAIPGFVLGWIIKPVSPPLKRDDESV